MNDQGRVPTIGTRQPTSTRFGRLPSDNDTLLVTRAGLRIPQGVGYACWAQAGVKLAEVVDSSSWCLGDWLVYGKRHFPDSYQRAINAAGLKYQTLRNYAWTARRFPLERRHHGLTFQHHAEVASLPEELQDRLLCEAENAAWTTKQLRIRVRNELASDQSSRGSACPANTAIPRIPVESSRLAGWQSAAQRVGIEFENWVIRVLDVAAEQTLRGATELG